MAAPRIIGRPGNWRIFNRYPFPETRQKRFASYQNFSGRGPRQAQYSRIPGVARLQYVWYNHRTAVFTVATGTGVVYLYNLESVPITGRRRFNLFSPEVEKRIVGQGSSGSLREVQGQVLPFNHPYTKMVVNVVERLLPSAKRLAGGEWKVYVIDDPEQMNAFVLPGGEIFVFTGLLPLCKDEDGLATVLGHEIAHNVARHFSERLSRSVFLLPYILATSIVFDISGGSVKFLSDLFFSLPNNRTHEAEADYIGLLLMAESCFNPEAAIPFWERMKEAQQGDPPQFLSTHPSDYNRIKAIKGWLDEAREKYQASQCGITTGYARAYDLAYQRHKEVEREEPVLGQSMPQRGDDEDDDFF